MAQATFIPGKPAVTQIIEPATEPKVTLELTLKEAALIKALLSSTHGNLSWDVYKTLYIIPDLPHVGLEICDTNGERIDTDSLFKD